MPGLGESRWLVALAVLVALALGDEILRDGALVRKRLQLTVLVTLYVVLVWRFVNFRWAG